MCDVRQVRSLQSRLSSYCSVVLPCAQPTLSSWLLITFLCVDNEVLQLELSSASHLVVASLVLWMLAHSIHLLIAEL